MSVPVSLNWRRVAAAIAAVVLLVSAIVWVSSGRGRSTTGEITRRAADPAIAEALALLNEGRTAEADSALRTYLDQHPDDDDARYALAYAAVLGHDLETAGAQFARLTDRARKTEGLAVVAHAKGSNDSATALQSALAAGVSPYPAVLLAESEVANGEPARAIKRLTEVDPLQMYFDWQRHEYARVLGRAYMSMGDYASARRYLGALPHQDPVSSALLAMAVRQVADQDREALRAQTSRLAERVDSVSPPNPVLDWTSRPLNVRIESTQAPATSAAFASGLVQALPEMLAVGLENSPGRAYNVVDRELIGDVLFEQELSELSKNRDAISIGRLRGARLAIQTKIVVLMANEYLNVRLIDTETTDSIPLEQIKLPSAADLPAWIDGVVSRISSALRLTYPIQGRLDAQGGAPTLNVGRSLGVVPGMVFAVFARPESGATLEGVTAKAIDPVDQDSARMELSGATLQAVPSDGWFLREIVAGSTVSDSEQPR